MTFGANPDGDVGFECDRSGQQPGLRTARTDPLALVIALSPLSIIRHPDVAPPRPRPTSLSFLVGWVLGIAVVTGAFVGGSGRCPPD